jgi:hypothetical protein
MHIKTSTKVMMVSLHIIESTMVTVQANFIELEHIYMFRDISMWLKLM